MGDKFGSHREARVFTLVLCIGAVLGGSLPELGNIMAMWLGIGYTHYFNGHFLVAGVVGFLVCYIALYRRRDN